MRRMALIVMVVGGLALAGCGDDGGSSTATTGAAVAAKDLDGRTFVADSATGHTLVPEYEVSVQFEDGRIAVGTGCNRLVGGYRLDGTTLRAEELAGTLMGCAPELERQQEWIAQLLRGDVTLTLAGDRLTLAGDGATIVLSEGRPAGTPPPVVGTLWTLDRTSDGDAESSVPSGVYPPTFQITADGRTAKIFTGCNYGAGGVKVGDDGFLTFGPISYTEKACDGAEAQLEAQVTSILKGRVAIAFEGENLSVAKQGRRLSYRPS